MSDPKEDPYNGELPADADIETDDVSELVPDEGDAKGLRTEGSGPLP